MRCIWPDNKFVMSIQNCHEKLIKKSIQKEILNCQTVLTLYIDTFMLDIHISHLKS